MNIIGFNQYCQTLSEGSAGQQRVLRKSVASARNILKQHGINIKPGANFAEINRALQMSGLKTSDRQAIAGDIVNTPESQKFGTMMPLYRERARDIDRRVFRGASQAYMNPKTSRKKRKKIERALKDSNIRVLAQFATPRKPGPRVPGGGVIPQSPELQQKIAAQQERNRIYGIE